SGWQQMLFSSPVSIAANTTYVASYHTAGVFGYNLSYFAGGGVDNGVLHALSDAAASGNGVYRQGATGFPTTSYAASNYWADVVFSAGGSSLPTVTIAATDPTAAEAGADTGT